MTNTRRPRRSDSIEFKTAFGWVQACATEHGVSEVRLEPRRRGRGEGGPAPPILRRLKSELTEYFDGRRRKFGLPLDLGGLSDFARAVLRECAGIPYGRTATYSGLAKAVGKPKAARAVGRVMARNPVPFLIPCHRVIGADGSLTGFGGGIGLKKRLLEFERGAAGRDR